MYAQDGSNVYMYYMQIMSNFRLVLLKKPNDVKELAGSKTMVVFANFT